MMVKTPPPHNGWRILKSVWFSLLTVGGPSAANDEVLPSGETRTGQMPALSAPDHSASSVTGKVS